MAGNSVSVRASAYRRTTIACLTAMLLGGCLSLNSGGSGNGPARSGVVRTAIQIALEGNPSGVAESWQDAATGHQGTVLPVRTYQTQSGLFCRDYTVTFVEDSGTRSESDTACRDTNGVWKDVG